jgi:hypothetical protein
MRQRLLPFVVAALAWALVARASGSESRIAVKYRSSANVYLEGGTSDGLAVGDRLPVLSRGEAVGEVEVVYVSEHSASCTIVSEKRPIGAGDVAILPEKPPAPSAVAPEPAPPSVATPSAFETASPTVPSRPVPWARARGSVAFGWYRSWDETPANFGFEQRNARGNLSLWDLWGRPYTLNARFRSRQDIRTHVGFDGLPQAERRDRLYELSLRYEPREGRVVWEAGRIGSSPMGIGYLDGVLAAYRPAPTLQVGGFFGNRPDIEGYAPLSKGRKYGGFVRLTSGTAYAPGNYDAQVAAIREFSGSELSREYVSYQGRLAAGSRFTSFQWAEVDVNTGWRQELAPSQVQLSNLSLSATYRVSASVQAGVSYDQRRNYWTQELRSLPEILFDKYLHQGFRARFDVFRPDSLGVSGSFGVVLEERDQSRSYSWGAGLRHPRLWGFHASVDGAGFTNPTTDGYVASARLGRTLLRSAQVDLSYGASYYTFKTTTDTRLNQWGRLSGRFDFPRRVYLQVDAEYDTGDDVKGPRAVVELGYRF